jgi:DivIVA domain-containing protein
MGILHYVDGLVFILLAASYVSRPVCELVRVRRGETRFRAIPAGAWSYLGLSLLCLNCGIVMLEPEKRTWLVLLLLVVSSTALAFGALDGILSSRRAGVSWWRFGVYVSLPPSAADVANGDDKQPGPDPADTLDPIPATALDARTLGLIEQIDNAKFSTTRLSAGYDEMEVDEFLDRLIAILRGGGQPDQEQLHNVRFAATRLRPGYVMQDVDGFLDEIARATLP